MCRGQHAHAREVPCLKGLAPPPAKHPEKIGKARGGWALDKPETLKHFDYKKIHI